MNNQTKEKTVSVTIKLPIDLYNRIDKYYEEVYEINNKKDRKKTLAIELVYHCENNIGTEYSY
jgi:hypothetical protein